jgi:DNA-binding IclR family transcriptional regulator
MDHPVAIPTGIAGSQAIERACAILKELARHGRSGARLLHLTEATRLSRPTAHRMLQSLIQEGFVTQHASRRYGLGPVLFELGLFAPAPIENLDRFRPLIEDLADRCGDTAYLMIKRGADVVYLIRGEGAYPIRTYVIAVGERLPMPASLGGIALLAGEHDDDVDAAMLTIDPANERFRNASQAYVRNQIEFVRKNGYGWGVDVVMEGVGGLAAAVPNRNGAAYLAVSISAIKTRLIGERVQQVSAMLLDTCNKIAAQVDAATGIRRNQSKKVGGSIKRREQ